MSIILKTAEWCGMRHPDFVCDHIADSILADMFEKDKNCPHAGIEALLYKGGVVIGGEMKTDAYIDIPDIARKAVLELGYNDSDLGLDGNSMAVLNCINKQSPCIDVGVSRGEEIGSGDQGFEFGFASDETPALLPLPNMIGMTIAKRCNSNTDVSVLGLDCKGMVTVAYDEETDEPLYIDTLVISHCYRKAEFHDKAEEILREQILRPAVEEWGFKLEDVKHVYINPTGSWLSENSCSAADCGVDLAA